MFSLVNQGDAIFRDYYKKAMHTFSYYMLKERLDNGEITNEEYDNLRNLVDSVKFEN